MYLYACSHERVHMIRISCVKHDLAALAKKVTRESPKGLTYLIIIFLGRSEIISQLRQTAVPGILPIATTITSMSSMAAHTAFSPREPLWAANKSQRCIHGLSGRFRIIFIATPVCTSSCWRRLRVSRPSPSLDSFRSMLRSLICRGRIFASVIAICVFIVIRSLIVHRTSQVSSTLQVSKAAMRSPHKCSCCGFGICFLPT